MSGENFTEYAERYKDTVYRIALNYLGNPEDADDIVQDVLLKLFTTAKRFKDDEHLKRWLIRVTLNRCANETRSRKHHDNTPIENITLAVNFETEEQLALFSAVMSLPERYRTVLYMYYYEGYSVKETGEILGIRESAVTTRLSRARERLKIILTEEDT